MTSSGALKLRFGPFWLKAPILLVNVISCRSGGSTYVLRVIRPTICGGRIELSIGHSHSPIVILPRSANDRRKFRFAVRYGNKGKTLYFLAPNGATYDHWVTVLVEAFGASEKLAKQTRNEMDTVITDDCYSDTGIQGTLINNSMRGSEESDTLPNVCHQRNNVTTDVDICSDIHVTSSTQSSGSDILRPIATEEPDDAKHRGDILIDITDNSYESSTHPTHAANPTSTTSTDGSHQNVYCAAVDQHGATLFSIYMPSQLTRIGCCPQSVSVYNLSSTKWLQSLARDVRGGGIIPEVFHITHTTCKRLHLREVMNIV